MNSNSPLYRENLLLNREQGNSAATIQHLVPMVPTPEERGAIAMSFMICLSVAMYEPFMNSNSPLYRENLLLNREQGNSAATIQHLVPMAPTPEEKGAIAMSFMICLSVGFA